MSSARTTSWGALRRAQRSACRRPPPRVAQAVFRSSTGHCGWFRLSRWPPTGRHQDADLILVGGPTVSFGHELAAVHDDDAVGHFQYFVELSGHKQDRGARVTLLDRST